MLQWLQYIGEQAGNLCPKSRKNTSKKTTSLRSFFQEKKCPAATKSRNFVNPLFYVSRHTWHFRSLYISLEELGSHLLRVNQCCQLSSAEKLWIWKSSNSGVCFRVTFLSIFDYVQVIICIWQLQIIKVELGTLHQMLYKNRNAAKIALVAASSVLYVLWQVSRKQFHFKIKDKFSSIFMANVKFKGL